jgi:hypothetical protein
MKLKWLATTYLERKCPSSEIRRDGSSRGSACRVIGKVRQQPSIEIGVSLESDCNCVECQDSEMDVLDSQGP